MVFFKTLNIRIIRIIYIMKFSTKTTYGLRAVIRLAKSDKGRKVSLASIAQAEDISLGYLEKLFSELKKADLVVAAKGVSGGYRLAKNPKKITVLEIISTLEGGKATFYCLKQKNKIYCSDSCGCSANAVMGRLEQELNSTLKNIKLSSLIN